MAAFSAGQTEGAGTIAYQEEQSPTLRGGASGTNQVPALHQGMCVRRLLPEECEKLQGFPVGYTLIRIPKKNRHGTITRAPYAADGPRYKALGNSMAVPCIAWIGRRIESVSRRLEGSDGG